MNNYIFKIKTGKSIQEIEEIIDYKLTWESLISAVVEDAIYDAEALEYGMPAGTTRPHFSLEQRIELSKKFTEDSERKERGDYLNIDNFHEIRESDWGLLFKYVDKGEFRLVEIAVMSGPAGYLNSDVVDNKYSLEKCQEQASNFINLLKD